MPLAIITHDWQPPQKDSAAAEGLVVGPWTLCGGTWMHGDHPIAALGYGAKQQPPRGSIPSPKKDWSLGVIIPNMLEHQHAAYLKLPTQKQWHKAESQHPATPFEAFWARLTPSVFSAWKDSSKGRENWRTASLICIANHPPNVFTTPGSTLEPQWKLMKITLQVNLFERWWDACRSRAHKRRTLCKNVQTLSNSARLFSNCPLGFKFWWICRLEARTARISDHSVIVFHQVFLLRHRSVWQLLATTFFSAKNCHSSRASSSSKPGTSARHRYVTKSTLEAIVNHQKKLVQGGAPLKNHSHPLTTYQRSIFKIIEQVSLVETMVYHGISILTYKPSCCSKLSNAIDNLPGPDLDESATAGAPHGRCRLSPPWGLGCRCLLSWGLAASPCLFACWRFWETRQVHPILLPLKYKWNKKKEFSLRIEIRLNYILKYSSNLCCRSDGLGHWWPL